MTRTPQQSEQRASCSRVWLLGRSILVGVLYLMAILAIHVRAADSPVPVASPSTPSTPTATSTSTISMEHDCLSMSLSLSFGQRLQQQGPNGLTFMDLLLFGTVVMIGFEIMSYLALHTGEWISAKRIPVRGKHLDDLTMVS